MGWSSTTYPARPVFVADWNSVDRNMGGQIDWSQVPDTYAGGVDYTIGADAASAAAETLGVDELPVAIPAGTILYFGADKYVKVTADADAGDETLTIEALTTALAGTESATFHVAGTGTKVIPAGTVLTQLQSGKFIPRALISGQGTTSAGLLMTTAAEGSETDSVTGYGIIVGGVIFENLLPETITSYKTELNTGGAGWVWLTYADSREASD